MINGSQITRLAVACGNPAACGGPKPLSAVALVEAECHPAHIRYPHEQNEPARMLASYGRRPLRSGTTTQATG
jgi:hypothetical protein